MPLTILVTGANGFVGRRLCQDLHRRGHRVRPAVREPDRAARLPGTAVCIGDLSAKTEWSAAVAGVDAVIHLAAAGVYVMDERVADESAYYGQNVLATEALARSAAANGVRRLVFLSSIRVQGDGSGERPFRSDDAVDARGPYAVSKWQAEQSLRNIAFETGLEVTIVRSPLIYGPRVYGNFLRLLNLVARGVPLPLGSIENSRSMIYNGNLASALTVCATHPAAAGGTYLVSDGEDLSTPQLIRKIAVAMGKPARLWAVPPPLLRWAGRLTGKSAEVHRLMGSLRVDSQPIREELGWAPPHRVSEGLADTARWYLESERGGA